MQVDGKEMDVEMKGKTKAKGKVGLEGSIQHGEDQVRMDIWSETLLCHLQDSDSAQLELVKKDEDEVKLRHLSAKANKKENSTSSDSEWTIDAISVLPSLANLLPLIFVFRYRLIFLVAVIDQK